MRLVFGLVLLLGVGLAGFAVYMAQDYMQTKQAQLDAERAARAAAVPTTPVFVAKRSIRYGEPLTKDDVRFVRWPDTAIPEGVFTDPADLFPENGQLRAVLRTMEKDEAVLASKVTMPGEDAGVSSRLSRGARAFTIRVDVTSGVSGFLRPGDRVDVYWSGTGTDSNGRRNDITKLIQAGVRIVAIDQSADEDRTAPTVARTVTVEASPEQVAALAQAQSTGRLSLSLVGAQDDTLSGAVEIDQRSLLGIVEQEVVEPEREEVCTIRTRRGSEVVEIQIPCTN